MKTIEERTGSDPSKRLKEWNATPLVEVKARRVGVPPTKCQWKSVLSGYYTGDALVDPVF